MNKEVKAIVDYLEEEREAIRTLCYYPDDVLNCEDLIMLMDYIKQLEEELEKADSITQSCIFLGKKESTMNFRTLLNELEKTKKEKNQLETNRDEAIEYVKNTYDDVVSSFVEDKPMTNFKARKDLLSMLERGKEC